MSEIKPVFWIKKEHFAEFGSARGDLGLTIMAWNNSLNEYAKAHELKSMEVPIYTADQLAEAVAAERERCAKVCEDKISGTFPDIRNPTDADHRQIAWDACCEELAEAIRSAAK